MKTVLKITWRSNLCHILTLHNQTQYVEVWRKKIKEKKDLTRGRQPQLFLQRPVAGHATSGSEARAHTPQLSAEPPSLTPVPLTLSKDTATFSHRVIATKVPLHALQLCHWGNLLQGRSENNWQQIYCKPHQFSTRGLQKTVWRKRLGLGII